MPLGRSRMGSKLPFSPVRLTWMGQLCHFLGGSVAVLVVGPGEGLGALGSFGGRRRVRLGGGGGPADVKRCCSHRDPAGTCPWGLTEPSGWGEQGRWGCPVIGGTPVLAGSPGLAGGMLRRFTASFVGSRVPPGDPRLPHQRWASRGPGCWARLGHVGDVSASCAPRVTWPVPAAARPSAAGNAGRGAAPGRGADPYRHPVPAARTCTVRGAGSCPGSHPPCRQRRPSLAASAKPGARLHGASELAGSGGCRWGGSAGAELPAAVGLGACTPCARVTVSVQRC